MSRSISMEVMGALNLLSEKMSLAKGRVILKSVKKSFWFGMSRESSSMGYMSSHSNDITMRYVESGDLSDNLRHRWTYRSFFDFGSSVKGT